MNSHQFRNVGVLSCAALIATWTVTPAVAQSTAPAASIIQGTVVDQIGSLPVSGARIELDLGDRAVAATTTDTRGAFVFANQPPNAYTVLIVATGYSSVRSDAVYALAGQTTGLTFAIARAQTNQLREIGRVSTSSRSTGGLQTSTTITRNISPDLLQRENLVRLADTLTVIPGVNLRGQSSSVGDDIYADIRGLKPSETQVLLDGHPVGPYGVFAAGGGGYNLQDSPLFALGNTQVTFGSGALGLYGVDAVGGTIDLQTIEPTRRPQFILKQMAGDQGRFSTALQATGTAGKLGFALVHGVLGTYGRFPTQSVFQSGLTAGTTDFTTPTTGGYLYRVSQNYLLRNDLLKLRYNLSGATALTLTGFTATSWDDKTGNGDNDFITYDNALYQAYSNGLVGSGGCDATSVPVTNDFSPGGTCISATQYARQSSGPAGGGEGAWQGIRNQDYHARLTTQAGKHYVTLDTFIDNYVTDYNRNTSFINGPTSGHSDFYKTYGSLISDDIQTERNDFGFGFYTQLQNYNHDSYNGGGPLTAIPRVTGITNSFFIRDAFTPSRQLSFFLNAWYKHTTVTGLNSLSPRLSIVFRPAPSDVFRVTGGRSDGEPAAQVRYGGALNLSSPGAFTNISCTSPTNVGSAPNPNVGPERSTDLELAYGHRFRDDTTIQAVLYDSNVTDQIFSGNLPAAQFAALFDPLYLGAVVDRYHKSGCSAVTPANVLNSLTISTTANAAKVRAKGLEISGRYRANRALFFDYSYDVQSTIQYDVPDTILRSSRTIVNGQQINGIPLHKASLGLDYTNSHGLEARIDGNFVGQNNALNAPGYTFANASLFQRINKNTSVNLGFENLFGSHADAYGRIGWGTFAPENAVYRAAHGGGSPNSIAQGSELFGLSPMSISVTVTQRVGGR